MSFIRSTDKLVEGSINLFFTEERAAAVATPLVEAEAARAQSAEQALDSRLDIVEGSGEGSVAKAEQDAKDYADQKVAALVNSAPEVLDTLKELSDALGGDQNFATTVAGQIGAVDGKVDQEVLDRQSAVSAEQSARELADQGLDGRLDILEQDPTTKTYVDGEVSAEESRAMSAESALSGRVTILEQDPTTKTYVDGEVSDLQGQITQEISNRQSAVSTEQSRAQSAESALSGRLDVLETDPTTKSYVDSEVSSEESRAMAAESALSGRVTSLETDPTTKTYVDGQVSGLQGQIDSEESRALSAEGALSGRLDTLELDPVTRDYVDSADNALQGQINTEKGRINAILSASEADKDSFAEIVQLINSVDASNDSAFAGYVLSNNAALAQEVSDRSSADSALDGRLDTLELDPVTKSYVDSADTTLQSNINSLLPSQTGNQHKMLVTSGSTKSWQYAGKGDGSFGTENVIVGRGKPTNLTGTGNIIIGENAGSNLTGSSNIVIGKDCGSSQSSAAIIIGINAGAYMAGSGSVAIGNSAAAHQYLNGWDNSVAIGASAGYQAAGGCVSIGADAGAYADQTYAVAVGRSALSGGSWQTPNHYSVALGAYAGANAVAPTSVFLGSYAGSRASSDKEFYLDCRQSQLATNALEKSNSLMYGKFHADPASQMLQVNAEMSINGGQKVKYESKSANYTLVSSDYVIGVSDLSSSKVMTLPSASSVGKGKTYIVKDVSGSASATNYIQLLPQSGQTIDGGADYKMNAPYESAILVSDGTNWFLL